MTSTEESFAADPLIGRLVLLVDDDPIQLKLAAAHLIDAGFEVTTATCASEAIEAARICPPDVIVSDVVMSELDGFALCGVLRSEPALERTPILLMSSHVDQGDDQRMARATGANAIVQRSPDFDAEFRALARILRASRVTSDKTAAEPSVSRMASQMARLLARSREAEQRYQTLFDEANDAFSVLTPDGMVLETNRRWEDILGMPREQMVGRHILDFAPPEHADSNARLYRKTVDEGESRLPAVPIVNAQGQTRYMEFSNKLLNVAGDPMVLAIGRDVTESVDTRRRLRASEERYRTLIEGIPDVVWSASLDGQILFISSRVQDVCGFAPQEIESAGPGFWLSRVHPEDLPGFQRALAEVESGSYQTEYRWQHRNGHWIWLRAHAKLRTDDRGNETAEGTFADITNHKRLEDQLRVAQKMEAIGQLTGGIAHDFNNILGVVIGNAEFLLGDLPGNDPRRADVETILDASRRAAALTRQLLTFSRNQVVEQRNVDLSRIVRELAPMLRRVIGEDVSLSIQAEDPLVVRADAGQLEQIVMNLVVNARDAMPQGGQLFVETTSVTMDGTATESGVPVPPGDYVLLAVSDSGCGMDEPTKRRIFEPFFTTKAVGRGTGLGLSTCYGFVKQSNGHISVYSEVGRGTTFKIYLPRTSSTAVSPSTPAGGIHGYIGGETILLVEDNAQLRTVIERTLKGLGYDVLSAGNADEALALHAANAGSIDLVLTDVVMPGAGGPDIVSAIRKRGGQPRVLYMSGYTEHAALRDQRLGSSINFLQKPFSPTLVARKVRLVLDATEAE